MGRRKCDLSQVQMLAEQGMTRAEIAKAIGVSFCTLYKHVKANKIDVVHAATKLPGITDTGRANKIAAMYKQGLTLAKIGTQFGLTRERVRQILRKHGVLKSDSPRPKMAALKRQRLDASREAQCLEKYGHPLDVVAQLRQDGVLAAFLNQKKASHIRGIDWNLDFQTWLAIWQLSGKLHLRGRGIGKYVMSRVRDDGGYELGNVHIQLATENSREAVEKWRGKKKDNPGVFLLYPGRSLAWMAKVGKKSLGFFETEADAVAARERYYAENPGKKQRGRGYSIVKSRSGRRTYYQVMVGRKYVGYFHTPEEALRARAAALAPTKEAA